MWNWAERLKLRLRRVPVNAPEVLLALALILGACAADSHDQNRADAAPAGSSGDVAPSQAGGGVGGRGASTPGSSIAGRAGSAAIGGNSVVSGGSGGATNAGSSGHASRAGAGGTIGPAALSGGAGAAGVSGQASVTAGASGSSGSSASQKFVGNITTNGQVRSDFSMYWNQITPENEGKWGSVEATRNQMDWSGLDRVHSYAMAHNIPFKQHNFVWGSQQPSWLTGLSAADQKAEVEEWIRLFCERYPDVALIDVVNEPPPHTTPVYVDALGGAGSSGYDWIVQAFRWAHQYCPNAILIMNDYNNIEYANDNSHFVDIVNRIKQAGAPIDAIGAQSHDAYKLSNSTVQGFLDALTATGLPVYITEYDIDLASDSDQQKIMQQQFPMFWNDSHVHGITLWGYIVGSTWKSNTGLVTSAGMKRPAMTWLMSYLGR